MNTPTASYQCNGNWRQQGMLAKDCVNDACTQSLTWSNVENCALSGKVCKNNVCVAGDTVPPVISGLLPSGTVNSSNATLAVTTNEPADCRYSWYDKNFDTMTLAFNTSNKLYHSVPVTLGASGSYVYYVRCRDAAGNINQTSGKISFRYVAPNSNNQPAVQAPPKVTAPADTNPPTISNLAPAGEVNASPAVISCATNEKATCKYDVSNTDYDSMEGIMDSQDGINHNKKINLSGGADYIYYIKCKDGSGNKNSQPVKISFKYIPPKKDLLMSGLLPAGTVYQKNVSLTVFTEDKTECHWGMEDSDFEAMTESFTSTDNKNHNAIVSLNDYGKYTYYVRCKDENGNKSEESSVISFEYKNPDLESITPAAPPAEEKEAVCGKIELSDNDGKCDNAADCACDPDCPASGDDADKDCADIKPQGKNNLIVILLAGFVLAAALVIAVMVKRKGGEEDFVEDV